MCTTSDYVGYDRNLGLCLCKVDDLQDICDEECRIAQRNRVQLTCDGDDPYVEITDDSQDVQVNSADPVLCSTFQHVPYYTRML